MIKYEIINSGSNGNAVVVNETVLIDCGVPFKWLRNHYQKLKLVLLTHIHGDHFNKSTIRRLSQERPTLRFACCRWLVKELVELGINKSNIDVVEFKVQYNYGICEIIAFRLCHNVPNCGYKVLFPTGNGYKKMIYATDTANMSGVHAKNYDLYLIEANHREDEIKQRIDDKKADGVFAYETQAIHNHLSEEKANDFIYRNVGANSVYVYLHQTRSEYINKLQEACNV